MCVSVLEIPLFETYLSSSLQQKEDKQSRRVERDSGSPTESESSNEESESSNEESGSSNEDSFEVSGNQTSDVYSNYSLNNN